MGYRKLLQKRLYSLLSDTTTFLTFLVVGGVVIVSTLQFGQSWLEWSSDKYMALADSFSNNIVDRSMRGRLCQYIPIDVVYTWVNGSDPWFLDELKHAKEERLKSESFRDKKRMTECHFGTCIPSHMVTINRLLPRNTRLDLVQDQNLFLREVKSMQNPDLICGSHVENRTVFSFESSIDARNALNVSESFKLGFQVFNLTLSYWSTEWTIPNSFLMPEYFMMLNIPLTATEKKIIDSLPQVLANSILKIWIHSEEKVAVLQSRNKSLVSDFLELQKIQFSSGVEVQLSPANLIIELPRFSDDETVESKRFADYDQLRYSLRSLERFAPWVRSVFLVTNGQIPFWLNLDHPKLTVVTHKEIFKNSKDLPTFSSNAIEANLHRIPGISKRFLYFNDDIFLGREVWPEDFFTEHEGFKIRWSWPLPDCSDNCPNSWINDGYCDSSCNNTKCMFDGGDCLGPNVKMGFGDQERDHVFNSGDGDEDKPTCSDGCMDSWLADKFCDESCNVPECAYDSADCGIGKFNSKKFTEFKLIEDMKKDLNHSKVSLNWNNEFSMPRGHTIAYWNLSSLFTDFDEVGLVPIEHGAIRSLSLSDEHKVMILLVRENMTSTKLNLTLQCKNNHSTVIHGFSVECNSVGHVRLPDNEEEDELVGQVFQTVSPEVKKTLIEMMDEEPLLNFDLDKLNLSEEKKKIISILYNQFYQDEEITTKGFRNMIISLLGESINVFLNNNQGQLSKLFKKSPGGEGNKNEIELMKKETLENETVKESLEDLQGQQDDIDDLPLKQEKQNSFKNEGNDKRSVDTILANDIMAPDLIEPQSVFDNATATAMKETEKKDKKSNMNENKENEFVMNASSITANKSSRTLLSFENHIEPPTNKMINGQRRLLDAYGESLIFGNQLLSKEYGFAARSVPAHIPHFVDLDVLAELIEKYEKEGKFWTRTSSHKFRSGDDIQFAFAYFNYIVNQKSKFDPGQIFDEFDTDGSGTWSDREVRTLLTKMHSLPLYMVTIDEFESKITKCEQILRPHLIVVDPPPYERYFDSKLPVLTKQLIVECPELVQELEGHFKSRQKFRHKIINEDEDSTFKRLTSNLSHVIKELDELRRNTFKFICINDETDPTRDPDNQKVHAFLVDFFESILPVPSNFELPRNVRNKFLHMSEFDKWNFIRNVLKWVSAISIFGLVLTVVCAYLGIDLCEFVIAKCTLLTFLFKRKNKAKNYTV